MTGKQKSCLSSVEISYSRIELIENKPEINVQFGLKMMGSGMLFHILWILVLCYLLGTTEASKRHKRELVFPKGGSFVAAVALVSFLPKGPTDGFAHVLEFDLGFPFPERLAIGKKNIQKKTWMLSSKTTKAKKHRIKPLKNLREKRNLKEEQRKNLLLKIEDVITRIGFNGSSCVSRFRCELQSKASKSSLLEELLFVLFDNSEQIDDRICEAHRLSCPISLLHVIMYSEQISSLQII